MAYKRPLKLVFTIHFTQIVDNMLLMVDKKKKVL